MEIFDVKYFPRIRSGALRVYAKYKENNLYSPSEDLKKMIKKLNNLLFLGLFAGRRNCEKRECAGCLINADCLNSC